MGKYEGGANKIFVSINVFAVGMHEGFYKKTFNKSIFV